MKKRRNMKMKSVRQNIVQKLQIKKAGHEKPEHHESQESTYSRH